MKKYLLVMIMATLMMLAGCGGAESADSVEDRSLDAVMANEAAFIAEDGSEVYLSDYECMEGVVMDPVRYAYVDFDGDGTDEVVVSFSEYDEWLLVLHKDGNPVYGYAFDIRSLNDLKADGSFIQSNSSDSSEYCKMTFDGNSYKIDNIDERDQAADVEWIGWDK